MNTNIQLLKISVLLEINVTALRRSIPVWGDNVSSADDTMEIYSPNHWHESWWKKMYTMVILIHSHDFYFYIMYLQGS